MGPSSTDSPPSASFSGRRRALFDSAAWLRVTLLALVVLSSLAAYRGGLSRGYDDHIAQYTWGHFLGGVCVAATKALTGLGGDVCLGHVSSLMNKMGLSGEEMWVRQAGGPWPDWTSDPGYIDGRLRELFGLTPWVPPAASSGPPYGGITGVGWGADLGYSDFIALSFATFGVALSSLYKGYWLIYGASLVIFCLTFHRRTAPMAMLAVQAVVHLSAFLGSAIWSLDGPIKLDTPIHPHFLSTLCIVPALHYLCAALAKERPGGGGLVALLLQGIVLILAIRMRTTVLWVVMAAAALTMARALPYFRYWRVWRVVGALPIIRRMAIPFLLVAMVVVGQAFFMLRAHPGVAANGYASSHSLWSAFYYTLSVHPDWKSRFAAEHDYAVGGDLTTVAWQHYLRDHPEVAAAVTNPEGNLRQLEIERIIRSLYLDFARREPLYVLQVFVIYNPLVTLSLVWRDLVEGMLASPVLPGIALLLMGGAIGMTAQREVRRDLTEFLPSLVGAGVVAALPSALTTALPSPLIDCAWTLTLALAAGTVVLGLYLGQWLRFRPSPR